MRKILIIIARVRNNKYMAEPMQIIGYFRKWVYIESDT